MPFARNAARASAAAVMVGLSLSGAGIAAADEADTTSSATAPASNQDRANASTAASRTPRQSSRPSRSSRRAAQAVAAQARSPRVPAQPASPRPDPALPVKPDLAAPVPSAPAPSAPPASAVVGGSIGTVEAPLNPGVVTPPRLSRAPAAASASGTVAAGPPAGSAVAAAKWFSSLLNPFQGSGEGIGLLIRRKFFNTAPTVNPVQLTGQSTGPITGTVGAVDPEKDAISYSVRQGPKYGSVTVSPDGTYTYTPAAGFTGADSFTIAATDQGRHINLLDRKRPASTEAYIQVAQGSTQQPKLSFDFIYGGGSQYWSTSARSALQSAANMLASYFVVSKPVTLTFDVTGNKSAFSSTLATAGSDLVDGGPGFFGTVVQNKILTGVDPNGSAADGQIDWNFGPSWAFGSSVGSGEYDFTSTAIHELLHTFGFLSNLDRPGSNSGRNWTTFDKFIVTSNGTKPIGSNYNWNSDYNSYLTGTGGGLYFSGTQAVATYGKLVPLYTPSPWENGSSMSHLDDSTFFGSTDKLMNARVSMGAGPRTLSPLELAILKDLGYQVNSQPLYAVLFLGFGLLRRRASGR